MCFQAGLFSNLLSRPYLLYYLLYSCHVTTWIYNWSVCIYTHTKALCWVFFQCTPSCLDTVRPGTYPGTIYIYIHTLKHCVGCSSNVLHHVLILWGLAPTLELYIYTKVLCWVLFQCNPSCPDTVGPGTYPETITLALFQSNFVHLTGSAPFKVGHKVWY